MQKITPMLWFDGNAEEAVNLYTSLFPNSRITSVARNPKGAPGPEGAVLTMGFELFGLNFVALNGGPMYKFTEAVSFVVNCETQEEIDRYWDALLAGGGITQACGWLKDKFGLSWQITPTILPQLLSGSDVKKSGRVMQAMMKMIKLDIAELKKAAEEE
jgi:predicted 3-demethylubiquinone-9 3-methyltransferase (glyoxalase superfamily)